jgi:hypothetical protein
MGNSIFSCARLKVDELRVRAAAEQRSQQGKRRGNRLLQQIHQDLPDEGPEAEFWVVERAGDRQIQIDDPIAVLEQRHRQFDGQGHGILAVGLVAEFELIDHDVMLGIELAVIHFVVQLGSELALGDVVARKLAGIGIEGGELHIAEIQRHIDVQRSAEHIHVAGNGYRRIRSNAAVQVDLGARMRLRRNAKDGSFERLYAGRKIRLLTNSRSNPRSCAPLRSGNAKLFTSNCNLKGLIRISPTVGVRFKVF